MNKSPPEGGTIAVCLGLELGSLDFGARRGRLGPLGAPSWAGFPWWFGSLWLLPAHWSLPAELVGLEMDVGHSSFSKTENSTSQNHILHN